jgi:hypothetical protein
MYNFNNDLGNIPQSDLSYLEDNFIVNELIFQREVLKNESLTLDNFLQILQSLATTFSNNL